MSQNYSPSIILSSRAGNNRIAYHAGRLTMSKTLNAPHFAREAVKAIREELAEITAALDAYEAAGDPDAAPNTEVSTQ
jgi:hypothetical protein